MKEQDHILVVEDESHLAVGIRYNLEADGYRVTVAEDGPSALRVLSNGSDQIDLIILDLMLPGMSGYDVCETLRDSGSNVPVLMLSARTLAEDRTRGFDVGADQYLTKPFDLDELLSRVKNLLTLSRRRVQGVRSDGPVDRFIFANSEINFTTHEVTVRGEHVRMTPLELNLLRYFVQNQGRVVPRGELLEKVWELPAHMNTRAPDQFIRRLRKIFEPDPTRPRYFLTVRDAGYRFLPRDDKT